MRYTVTSVGNFWEKFQLQKDKSTTSFPSLLDLNIGIMPGAVAAISHPQDKVPDNSRNAGPDTTELLRPTMMPPTTRFLVI